MIHAQADTRAVNSRFERCGLIMERVDRAIRRYEDIIEKQKRIGSTAAGKNSGNTGYETVNLENKLEYFNNRADRARNQADRIRDELKNISGPSCPSCIESSVNLYCRSAEDLLSQIEEQISISAEMMVDAGTASRNTGQPEAGTTKKHDYPSNRRIVDSLIAAISVKIGSCPDKSAAVFFKQAITATTRADSLATMAGDTVSAQLNLNTAETLIRKAELKCGPR
jgi:hypothetical protein